VEREALALGKIEHVELLRRAGAGSGQDLVIGKAVARNVEDLTDVDADAVRIDAAIRRAGRRAELPEGDGVRRLAVQERDVLARALVDGVGDAPNLCEACRQGDG